MSKVFEIAFKLGGELTSSFKNALGDAQKQLKSLNDVGEYMQKTGGVMTKFITAPVAGLATAAIAVGANFEEGMSKVAAVSGATGSDLEKLTAKARELGAKTQFSATEAAEGLNYMAMAGWDTQQMLGGIDGVMSLAAASGEELALVSDIVTDAMTAFGMKAEESGRFADVLAAASSSANTNVAMLGESFKYVAPLAGAMGYSAEDTSVALSLMANAGIKGSQSGTALKTMLANMASPTKQMKKSMDALGISLTNSDGSMKSLDEVMRTLRGSFADLDEIQQASAASTIFGKEAMAGALAVINASEEDFEKLTGAINNSNGAAEEMAKVVNDNLKGRIKEMQSALEEAGISIYYNLQPALEAGVAMIQKVADAFNGLPPSAQNTVLAVAGVAAAIGPALIVGGMLIKTVVNTIATYKAAATAIKSFSVVQALSTKLTYAHRTAMLASTFAGGGLRGMIAGLRSGLVALNLTLLANPFVMAAAAIALVTLAFYSAWKNSETFRNIVIGTVESVKKAFLQLAEKVKWEYAALGSNLEHIFITMSEKVTEVMNSKFVQGAINIAERFVESFKTGLSSLPGIISMIAPTLTTVGLGFLGITGPVGIIIGAVVSLIGFIYRLSKTNQGVADAMSKAWETLKGALEPVLKVFSEGFADFAEQVGPQLQETINVIVDSFTELGPAFAEVGATLGELIQLIISTFSEVAPIVVSVGLDILKVFQTVFPAVVSIVSTVMPIVAQLLLSIVPIILLIVQTVIPLILSVIQMVFPIILAIIQAVLPVFASLLTIVIEVILQLVQTVIPMILTVVQAVLPVVLAIIQAIIPMIAAVLEILVAVINGVVIPAINAILAVVQIVFPYIQMIIENALAIINGIIQTAMALLQGDWSGAWDAIKSTAETIMNNIIGFFQGINLFETGKAVITGLIDGIKSMGSAVIGAITDMIPAPIRGVAEKVIGSFKGYAEGGIVTAPELAWIGEGGDVESVIPWNSSQRSKDLWLQTGRALGMLGDDFYNLDPLGKDDNSPFDVVPGTSNKGGGTVIHLKNEPTIIIQGDAKPGDVEREVNNANEDLYDTLEEKMKDKKRAEFD